jgi:hypothetical protein
MENQHALFFIATGRGFVREVRLEGQAVFLRRTRNVRAATPYPSFAAADDVFRTHCASTGKGEYYSVLSNVC